MKEALLYLSQSDPIFSEILTNQGQPIFQKRPEGFASMCHIILEQQVSIASAQASYTKLLQHCNEINPTTILNSTQEELRNCGISRQKSNYLQDLAQKVTNNDLNFTALSTKTEEQIRAELIQIKGIGHWTIDVYLMFCLQLPDIIPLGDIAIRTTLKELYQCTTIEQMEEISNNWKPYRTSASYILWHYYLKKRGKI